MSDDIFSGDLIFRRFNITSESQWFKDDATGRLMPGAANFERDPKGISGYSVRKFFDADPSTVEDTYPLQYAMVDLSYHDDPEFKKNIFCVYRISVDEAENLSPYKFISFVFEKAPDGNPVIQDSHVNMFFGQKYDLTRKQMSQTFENWKTALMSKIEVFDINQPNL